MKTYTQVLSLLALLFSTLRLSAREPDKHELQQFAQSSNLAFVANAGQVTDQHYNPRKDIDFKLNAPGMNIFIGDGEIHYQWSRALNRDLGGLRDDRAGENNTVEIYRLDVQLIGANKDAKVIAEEQQEFYERYYTMETGDEGLVVHSYHKIIYKDIYPNIDWVVYTKNNQLKYDFVVKEGGEVSDIKIRYEGATSLQIEDGALTVVTHFGSITEEQPYSYEAATKRTIESRYILEDNVLSFATENYTGTLVIDPVLDWSSYYGGASGLGNEIVNSVVTDHLSNIYAYGVTPSTANIVTVGAFQTSFTGGQAGFLVKMNTAGQRQWATYYNGIPIFFTGEGPSLACDAAGMIYMTGRTSSTTNIATPGTHQGVYGGGTDDVFIAKFDAAGQRIWGTYYGGGAQDVGTGITADMNGDIYLGGISNSPNNISTPGSFQPTLGVGSMRGFIAKFNNLGQRVWGTYYNGDVTSIAADLYGNIFVGGMTLSSALNMTTPGCHQPVFGGSGFDGFVSKFSAGGQRIWSTYYGGNADELTGSVATDISGNVYFSGSTSSTNNIASPGAHQAVFGGGPAPNRDGFLVKFDGNGIRQWGTYYGSTGHEEIFQMSFDAIRNVYFAGVTSSSAGIATPGSHQPVMNGGGDAMLVKFSQNGQRIWGSYVGGNGGDLGCSVATDPSGNVIIGGGTNSTGGLSTPGSHQPVYGGGDFEGFIAKFGNEDTLVYIQAHTTDTVLCAGDTVHVGYGVSHNFRSNNTFTLQLSDAAGSFASPTNLATVNTNAAGVIAGFIPGSITPGTDYRIRIVASAPADTTLYKIVRIRARPAKPTATSNTPLCAGSTINLSGSSTTTGVTYSWTGPGSYTSAVQNPVRSNATLAMAGNYILKTMLNGCTSEADTAAVVVISNPPAPVATNNGPICAGNALDLFATGQPGASYQWNGPGGYNTTTQNPTRLNVNPSHAGTYTVTQTVNGCTSAAGSTTVVVNTAAMPTVTVYPNPNDSVCPGALVTFVAVPTNGGTPTYRWFKNTLQIPGATAGTYQTSNVSTGDFYSVEMTSTQPCAVPATVNSSNVIMTVVPPVVPSVTITASPGLNVGPWRMITFTATPVNGGPSPVYQWLRNGQPVIGAISNTWGAANLSDNDVISVALISSKVCAIPPTDTSNVMTVHINMGIDDEDNNTPKLQLYPNPNKGNFMVRGNINSKEVLLEVFNSIGQMVHSERIAQENKELDHGLQLEAARGVYMLRVSTDEGVEVMRFRVE